MTLSFEDTVVVPVADPDDGERTAAALEPYLSASSTVVAVNVIEKAGGAPDKASVEQREEYAAEIFERVGDVLEGSPATLETEVRFGTDVVDRIFETALERDADAVVFVPRSGNRLAELLSGDLSRRIVREAAVPVVSLPRGGD